MMKFTPITNKGPNFKFGTMASKGYFFWKSAAYQSKYILYCAEIGCMLLQYRLLIEKNYFFPQ